MLRRLLLLQLLSGSFFMYGQSSYFQQHVSYSIDVTLDDKQHSLSGYEKIVYTNHSSDTLNHLYFHLWPNAYKNDKSSFTQQNVENRQTKFYYSHEEERGSIDSLNFKVNNESVNISNYNNHEDIIVLELNTPLLPAQSIEISTPFKVKIPYTFSRLGHVGQSYQISQWYPKPAVYDKDGWHPMPYLDQGEFYSEYGEFNVQITLPSNYIVAATGDLQEESEKLFITSKMNHPDTTALKADSNIVSSALYKTITFKQSNVHDFAWFADKTFQVEKTMDTLPSGKTVDCYSYYKPIHSKYYKGSSKIIAHTISYLSAHVGDYPYKHASIVDGSLLAGDGMEYPNVAVIGGVGSVSSLQTVIIHEVGHNWFYGLLGSNERDHPWMDESINSFYEKEIKSLIQQKKSETKIEERVGTFGDRINGVFSFQLSARKNADQKISLPSTEYTNFNYGSIIYQKGPMLIAYLKAYLGEDKFDRAMKRYYHDWHFKHPTPADFKKIICEESGKDLHWFFEDGIHSTKQIDYKIASVTLQGSNLHVKARSRTNFNGPIPINACRGNDIIETQWIEYPYTEGATFKGLPSDITSIKIDANQQIPEIKISNNQYKLNGLFHRFQPSIRLGCGLGISKKNNLFLMHAVGYNFYDKFMLGGIIHNLRIPNPKFQFTLSPLYSIETKSLTGSGFVSYSMLPHRIANEITVALQARTYHHNESHLNINQSIYARHIKLMPSITIDFKNKLARSPISNQLVLRYYHIMNQSLNYTKRMTDSLFRASLGAFATSRFASIKFAHKNNRTFNPFYYNVCAIGNNEFAKASIEAGIRIDYAQKGKSFYGRIYSGKFVDFKNNNNPFIIQQYFLNATNSSANDFTYDEVYLGRNEQSGILSQQVSMQEGGFKIKSQLLNNPIGQNSNWLTAINLRSDLPIKLPLKVQVFLDAGTYADAAKLNNSGKKVIFDAGLEIHFFKELLNIYVPLLMSKDFQDYTKSTYPKNRLLRTISFSFNINRINWFKTQQVIDVFN